MIEIQELSKKHSNEFILKIFECFNEYDYSNSLVSLTNNEIESLDNLRCIDIMKSYEKYSLLVKKFIQEAFKK